ncbi:MAG: 4Fe-4S dicluster domain-containing protein [Chloroflexi bacterium]|nr:MAG: 4Fe-4S dicluster domain-containing protein [Chloroflexota bacterium]
MFGLGVAKGLGITLKHFIETFVDDLKYFPKSLGNPEAFARRQGPSGRGLFTVEYPEVKLPPKENFRFLPFLITDFDVPKDSPEYDPEKAREQIRCTSCGICAKVCPPQCIWIVRTNDPKTGKPVPQPAAFYIDTDVCMNCGYCAEFCPFDAIKMDHDFELADYEREVGHIHDLQRLMKPVSYYAQIRPTFNAMEEAARRAAEEEKRRKEEEKKRRAAEKAAAKAAAAKAAAEKPAAEGKPKRSPEEIKAQREAMLAKKQAREAARAQAEGGQAEAAAPAPAEAPAQPDDLTKIEGIGPKINALLQNAGITTFAQLAATDVEKIQQILTEAGSRYQLADPGTWPQQAKLAAEGKWEELQKLQDSLKGGRRQDSE